MPTRCPFFFLQSSFFFLIFYHHFSFLCRLFCNTKTTPQKFSPAVITPCKRKKTNSRRLSWSAAPLTISIHFLSISFHLMPILYKFPSLLFFQYESSAFSRHFYFQSNVVCTIALMQCQLNNYHLSIEFKYK